MRTNIAVFQHAHVAKAAVERVTNEAEVQLQLAKRKWVEAEASLKKSKAEISMALTKLELLQAELKRCQVERIVEREAF